MSTKKKPPKKLPGRAPERCADRHFIGASEADQRAAYVFKLRQLSNFLTVYGPMIEKASFGSEHWQMATDAVAKVYDAVRGRTVENIARDRLIGALDMAVRLVAVAPADRAAMLAAAKRIRLPLSPDDRPWFDKWGTVRGYLVQHGFCAFTDPSAFVVFMFRQAAPEYVAALETPEAMKLLGATLQVWGQRGAPPAGGPAPWGAAYALAEAIGIADVSREAFEAEGRASRAKNKVNNTNA